MQDRSRLRLRARLEGLEARHEPDFMEAFYRFRDGGPLPDDERVRSKVVELVGLLAEIRRRRNATGLDERLEDLMRRARVQ